MSNRTIHGALAAVCALAVLGALAPSAQGYIILTERNSTVKIDPNSPDGMFSWVVDGVEHLYQQWFFFRVGSTGGELSIDALKLTSVKTFDVSGDNVDDELLLRYSDQSNRFTMSILYVLTGSDPGNGVSDIAETISIKSKSTQTLDFHFFQYSNFDLRGTPGNDTVTIRGGNTATQRDGLVTMSETVVAPDPTLVEAAIFPSTINSLQDLYTTTLDGNTTAGPGDVTWAFEWDFQLAPGQTKLISKDKLITPEPGTVALVCLGGLGLVIRRRRRLA
jgi:hypothetical protein